MPWDFSLTSSSSCLVLRDPMRASLLSSPSVFPSRVNGSLTFGASPLLPWIRLSFWERAFFPTASMVRTRKPGSRRTLVGLVHRRRPLPYATRPSSPRVRVSNQSTTDASLTNWARDVKRRREVPLNASWKKWPTPGGLALCYKPCEGLLSSSALPFRSRVHGCIVFGTFLVLL